MESNEFINRLEELAARCDRSCVVTATGFLTPAEQLSLAAWANHQPDCRFVFHGGHDACERKAAFFLPYYITPEEFQPEEYIRAVKLTAFFGEPGHRDYMGAALGLGIKREWLGDFQVDGGTAYVFCLPSVEPLLLEELTKVGRYTVKAASCALDAVPAAERRVRTVTFTVKSLRLDAVTASLFGLSRTAASELIRMGAASLNYAVCQHTDAPVKQGDVVTLRGHGKATVTEVGGRSRKDRLFITGEIAL